MHISPATILVSEKGGFLDIVSDEGEVLARVFLSAGRHRASSYTDLLEPHTHLEVSDGLVAFPPRSGVGIQPYGEGSHDSGANPLWKPLGNAEQLQRQIQRQMASMQAETKRLTARLLAAESVEHIPAPRSASEKPVDVVIE